MPGGVPPAGARQNDAATDQLLVDADQQQRGAPRYVSGLLRREAAGKRPGNGLQHQRK